MDELSVLIVDDVKSMRSIIRNMLKHLSIGQHIHMAENGVEGLKILNTTRIDLAIVDWKMPMMNGAELLEVIRTDRNLRDIPVLMVTAESEKDIVLEVAEIEVEGYLLKPLTPAILEEKIIGAIRQITHPDKATIAIKKSRTAEENGDIKTAIEYMAHAVKLRPAASRLLRKLGLLYQKADDDERMERSLLKAASVNPQDAVSRQILGDFYWKRDKWPLAARYYREVISTTRRFNKQAVNLCTGLLQRRYSVEAKQLFSVIISKSPKNFELVENIVNICIRFDELTYALKLLKKLINDFPSNYELIYQTGLVCEMIGDQDSALDYFLTVDKHQFTWLEVKLKIAKIYRQKNKIIQADDYVNMVLKRDPDNEEALSLRRTL